MSDAPKTRPQVPEGKTRFLTTRQKPANEKGYVGYDTIWESFHKEVRNLVRGRAAAPHIRVFPLPRQTSDRYSVTPGEIRSFFDLAAGRYFFVGRFANRQYIELE